MTYQRAVLPPRTDLRTRRKRVAATAAIHVEDLYELLKSRVLVEVADVDTLVEKFRREGVDVTYHRFRFGGHMTVAFTGAPGSLHFLSQRLGAP